MSDWFVQTWRLDHATHGTFFITQMAPGSDVLAQRVYVPTPNAQPQVEAIGQGLVHRLGYHSSIGAAMLAIESRVSELDQLLINGLRAYAEKVA